MKKALTVFLLLCCALTLLTGCQQKAEEYHEKSEVHGPPKTRYMKKATVYISSSVSPSDTATQERLAATYANIIQSDFVLDDVRAQYPNTEFTVTLDWLNETEVYELVVMGNEEEKLADICNAVAQAVCEGIPRIIEDSACAVIAFAE